MMAAIAISCGTLTRTVMAPPSIPGAEYVGSEICADCHDGIVAGFRDADHARLQAQGENAIETGCESCHGPGSLHADSGEPVHILNPGEDMRLCFNCHLNTRAEFMSPSRHPIMENRLDCGDCHDPHEGSAHRSGGFAMMSANEGCLECHPSQRGPHVFEHEAVREGCLTCHRPHGSVNANLLTERNATLCLKCHFQQQTAAGQVFIGGINHSTFLPQGTCWSAGCHEAVHGSQVNSSLRY
jgi:predicted CXXCH cytochrome family protein